jgi:hypothetical protein
LRSFPVVMCALRKPLSLCLAGAGLALVALAQGTPAQRQPQTFSASVVVREREVVVDLPENVARKRLAPGDFRVFVDGRPREVTRVEPAAGDWTIVLYFDEVLASPETTFYSGLALASRARKLARLASVEVAAAGPDPRVALPPTREARRIELALTDLASPARIERDRAAARMKGSEPRIPQIGRQLDKLLAFLRARHPAGPHAVFLVADGADLSPAQTARIESGGVPGAEGTPASVFHRAARRLAAAGWVTIPVRLRQQGPGIEIPYRSDVERFRQAAAPSDHQNGVPPLLPGRPPRETALSYTGVIDFLVAPETAALRALAEPTAGTVIGFEPQLDAVLDALPHRWRLWFAEPEAAADGRLHRLAVSLPRMKKEARAPEWLPSP